MTVRVLVVGTGFGARVVAPVFSETRGCAVVQVVSARDDEGIASGIARERPDLVTVHSPPFLHDRHVRIVLDAGVGAVMCDKPFTIGADTSESLCAAAVDAGVRHLMNFEFRCDPGRERLRALVRDGAVGRVERVSWTHWSSASRVPLRRYGWLFDESRGGGFVNAWGSHAVDTLRWLLDDELHVATAALTTTIRTRPGDDGERHQCSADDAFTATLRSTRDVEISLDASFVATASLAPRILVGGSDGVLELIGDARLVRRGADGAREVIDAADDAAAPDAAADRHLLPMRRWAERVRDVVTSGLDASTPLAAVPTFADGVACDRVLAAIRNHRAWGGG
ncbi:MAG TPA: Gfo/Idh/MocA family oxidoreductase, partial [Acidimicrobiia bacterium]